MRCSARFAFELRRLLVGSIIASAALNGCLLAAPFAALWLLPAASSAGLVASILLVAMTAAATIALLAALEVARTAWFSRTIARAESEFVRQSSSFVYQARTPAGDRLARERAWSGVKASFTTRGEVPIPQIVWLPFFCFALLLFNPVLGCIAGICCSAVAGFWYLPAFRDIGLHLRSKISMPRPVGATRTLTLGGGSSVLLLMLACTAAAAILGHAINPAEIAVAGLLALRMSSIVGLHAADASRSRTALAGLDRLFTDGRGASAFAVITALLSAAREPAPAVEKQDPLMSRRRGEGEHLPLLSQNPDR